MLFIVMENILKELAINYFKIIDRFVSYIEF